MGSLLCKLNAFIALRYVRGACGGKNFYPIVIFNILEHIMFLITMLTS